MDLIPHVSVSEGFSKDKQLIQGLGSGNTSTKAVSSSRQGLYLLCMLTAPRYVVSTTTNKCVDVAGP